MSNLPEHLRYAATHEWAYLDEDGLILVGITDFAQEALGDLMSVELPEVGAEVSTSDEMMYLESVKANSDIFAPVSGEIVEVNEELDASPEMINDEPYDSGWLVKIQPNDAAELDDLMSPDEYQAELDSAE